MQIDLIYNYMSLIKSTFLCEFQVLWKKLQQNVGNVNEIFLAHVKF